MMLRALLLSSCCLFLGACSSWHYEIGEPVVADASLVSAKGSSLTAVLEQLGPPLRLSATADGYVMAWEHWQITERALGINLGALGSDVLSLDWGDAKVAASFLLLHFNRQHQLSDSQLLHWQGDLGAGRAVQPLGIATLTDVEDLRQMLPAQRWGANWLLPMPQVLNAANAPGQGDAGIEQRGTPTAVGQRSLEMR